MELIDNINRLLGDDLKRSLKPGTRLKVAASCFSMYAFEALKEELEQVDELCFIFTSPTFVAEEVTDKIRKERKEFHIPKLNRERSLYGSEFEIHLRNKLTQRATARECADWLRRKARFMSNRTQAPMQPFACVEAGATEDARTVYMPLHGFTAVDLGYQPGNAVSNLVNKMDEPPYTATYLQLFDQIWNDAEKVEDVTGAIVDQIATVCLACFIRLDRAGARIKGRWPMRAAAALRGNNGAAAPNSCVPTPVPAREPERGNPASKRLPARSP